MIGGGGRVCGSRRETVGRFERVVFPGKGAVEEIATILEEFVVFAELVGREFLANLAVHLLDESAHIGLPAVDGLFDGMELGRGEG